VHRYGRAANPQHQMITEESWIDFGRSRSYQRAVSTLAEGQTVATETVLRDDYATIYQDGEVIGAHPVHPLQARLQLENHAVEMLRKRLVGDPQHLSFYRHEGVEVLEGEPHDVWVGKVPVLVGDETQDVRVWLRAGSGELKKLEISNDDESIRESFEVLARDAEIPAELFESKPPGDEKELANPQPNGAGPARPLVSFGLGDGVFQVNFVFRLSDGSVLMAWRDGANLAGELQRIFDGLESGDPLPDEFPISAGPLRTVGLPVEVEFAPHFLTHTLDEAGLCAWSLYIPKQPIAGRERFLGYVLEKANAWIKPAGRPAEKDFEELPIACDISIDGGDQFQSVVVEVMRIYATRQPDRSFPQYESVLDLARQLRESYTAQ
jgi:hypothetical protein